MDVALERPGTTKRSYPSSALSDRDALVEATVKAEFRPPLGLHSFF